MAVVFRDGPVLYGFVVDEKSDVGYAGTLSTPVIQGVVATSGVLVDPDGAPLPGIDLLFRMPEERFHLFGRTEEARATDLVTALSAGVRLDAVTRTDTDGRFTVRVLDWPAYEVVLGSKRWLAGPEKLATGAPDATLHARPAFAVEGTAVDAETAQPLAGFGARVSWPGGDVGLRGLDGRFGQVVPWPDGQTGAFDATALAEADGYEPARETVRVSADRTSEPVTLRLKALAPGAKAGIAFEIVDRDPAFPARPFDLEMRDPPGNGPQRQRVPCERVDATHVRATVPAGTWHVRLRPGDGWCNPVAWGGVVDLPEGKETSVRWTVPPHGSAKFVVAPDLDPRHSPRDLLVWPAGGSVATATYVLPGQPADRLTVQAMTVGDWVAHLEDGEIPFTVRAGETVEVDLRDQ